MRATSTVLHSAVLTSLMLAVCAERCGAAEPAAVYLPNKVPLISASQPRQANIARTDRFELRSVQSINGQKVRHGAGPHLGRTLDLTHGKKMDPDASSLNTIPHWSDSFTYNGLVYKYTMVGTDPKRGSVTTVIPTVLIPLRFVLADGNVFDATTDIVNGQTPIQGIINSPIFQNYDFNHNAATYYFGGMAGLVKVGNTQYGDAFQRANFWDSVSTRAPNYHVLLGQPTVLPMQTINVPAGLFSYYTDPDDGNVLPVIDYGFLISLVNPVLTAAHVTPDILPIMVWSRVLGTVGPGYHGITNIGGNSVQTFIAASYLPGTFAQDVEILSHEIVEWIDDPYLNSITPGWDIPFLPPNARCDSGPIASDRLEVADPVSFFLDSDVALPGAAYTYHVTEAMFVDFYTRSSRSRSYNGQYSLFQIGIPYGNVTPPSSPCTGHVEFIPTYVDVPGATFTAVTGINNGRPAIGFYNDAAGMQHGFVFDGSKYSIVDYPAAVATTPYKISDTGTIVGTFQNAAGGVHGFSYSGGVWKQIDFPGSFDTEVYGINAAGSIVGTYDGLQPITHAFVLRNGEYQRIDTPFGTQTNAFAINSRGSITGLAYTDPFNGPFTSFIRSQTGLSVFQFPDALLAQVSSINSSNEVAGLFIDPDGSTSGLVTVSGRPYQVYGAVFGNDDLNRICGYTFDATGRQRGFIGTLPLQPNEH